MKKRIRWQPGRGVVALAWIQGEPDAPDIYTIYLFELWNASVEFNYSGNAYVAHRAKIVPIVRRDGAWCELERTGVFTPLCSNWKIRRHASMRAASVHRNRDLTQVDWQ